MDKDITPQPAEEVEAETVFTPDILDTVQVVITPKVIHPEIEPPESVDNKGIPE